jgi:UPF0288 family protein (methanogenesis marker protein 3)
VTSAAAKVRAAPKADGNAQTVRDVLTAREAKVVHAVRIARIKTKNRNRNRAVPVFFI